MRMLCVCTCSTHLRSSKLCVCHLALFLALFKTVQLLSLKHPLPLLLLQQRPCIVVGPAQAAKNAHSQVHTQSAENVRQL